MSRIKPEDVHIRVIDQRIGAGIGGNNTVVRVYHIPTGILIEMPPQGRGQWHDRNLAMEMLEYGLSELEDRG